MNDSFFQTFHAIIGEHISETKFKTIVAEFEEYRNPDLRLIPFEVCQMIRVSNHIGFKETDFFGFQLVLLISIIELLMTRYPYVSFIDWYKQNEEEFNEIKCLHAYQQYNEMHGLSRKFREFFCLNIRIRVLSFLKCLLCSGILPSQCISF